MRRAITAERVIGEEFFPADDVILAIGQENAFPWIERDLGIEFDKWNVPKVDKMTFQSTRPGVFFGGDARSARRTSSGRWSTATRPPFPSTGTARASRSPSACRPASICRAARWACTSGRTRTNTTPVERRLMPHVSLNERFKKINVEVELGFTAEQAAREVQRCLNCDVQTVFTAKLCIECDACLDICPVDCLTITHNGPEASCARASRRRRRTSRKPLYVSAPLPQTGRVMVKDEDLCVHCGLCAERCPTAAWDMQKSDDPLAARPRMRRATCASR